MLMVNSAYRKTQIVKLQQWIITYLLLGLTSGIFEMLRFISRAAMNMEPPMNRSNRSFKNEICLNGKTTRTQIVNFVAMTKTEIIQTFRAILLSAYFDSFMT